MTIKEVISQLELVENKELELYVCDKENNNISINDITLFDSEAEHTENNPLGINY
ncbi:hypothetical protein vBSauMSDQ_0004 [Staphylococcus phage vB_SauM-SDQ]